MATLLVLPQSLFTGDEDAQLVAGDVAASPENTQSSRAWWAFDDTNEEAIVSSPFVMPTQYTGSGLVLVVFGFFKTEIVAADEAHLDVYVEAVTPGDAVDMESATSWGTANGGNVVPVGTAGNLVSLSITLTNDDGAVVGDLIRIGVRRDPLEANDDATGDLCIIASELKDDG